MDEPSRDALAAYIDNFPGSRRGGTRGGLIDVPSLSLSLCAHIDTHRYIYIYIYTYLYI